MAVPSANGIPLRNLEDTRLGQIPVLHVRGTHHVVGYTIGRTLKNSIQDTLRKDDEDLAPAFAAYNTPEGKNIYQNSLELCRRKFPGYVEELEGMSEGCEIPFYKLFILHIDTLINPPTPTEKSKWDEIDQGSMGCSSVLSFINNDKIFLGHTEDGPISQFNNAFVLCAEILDKDGVMIEKFSTICYAGFIPGGTMGFNHHGVLHSVNSISPGVSVPNNTPMLFQLRALLRASNATEVADILRDTGTGTSDGISVNIVYIPKGKPPIVLNIEMGPNPDQKIPESEISIVNVSSGESFVHCNKILRLTLRENNLDRIRSSINRHKAIESYARPYDFNCIKNILSDQSNPEFPVFRDDITKYAVTLVAGIFDIENRVWLLYTYRPSKSSPIVKIPLEFF